MDKDMNKFTFGQFYLDNKGMLHKTENKVDPTTNGILKIWNLIDVARTPETFVKFLKEAKKLGARKSQICNLAGYGNLDEKIPDWGYRVYPEDIGR